MFVQTKKKVFNILHVLLTIILWFCLNIDNNYTEIVGKQLVDMYMRAVRR